MGEDWSWLHEHSLKGLRGSPGKSLDLPKWQETIVSRCVRRGDSEHCLNELQRCVWAVAISVDTRDGHEMLRLLLQPPRILCASTGHYPHLPSCEPVQPANARVLWSRDSFPRRTRGMPQDVTMSCRPLSPQACPAFCTPPSPPAWVSQIPQSAAPLTPFGLGSEEMPSGDLHTEAGPNPKLNPRSCVNKEEKGKFLPAASGATD